MLRWKKEHRETGLSAIGAGPRPSYLHDGKTVYARVYAIGGGYRGPIEGWYFVAGWDSNVPHKNTCDSLVPTENEAKHAGMKYVRSYLAARAAGGGA